MCIIVSKESGQKMPTKATLKECFNSNKDGAGIMFYRNDSVHIDKGYMTFRKFWKALQGHKFTVSDTVVLHFRISTAGMVRPQNTHPFPLHKDLDEIMKLKTTCKQAVVHNGIIGEGEGKLSDTMLFVRDVLADPMVKNNLARSSIDNLISMSTEGSKLVIMNEKGTLRYYGAGWIKDHGIYYSNSTYKAYIPKWQGKGIGGKGKGYGVYVNGKKVKDEKELVQAELVETTSTEEWDKWNAHNAGNANHWAVCVVCGGDLYEIDEYGEFFECDRCMTIFDENYQIVYQDKFTEEVEVE